MIIASGHINHLRLILVKRILCIAMLFFFVEPCTLFSQTGFASEYQVKAVFLFNFSHFITWPENAFEDQYSTFIIGIIGDDPFGPYIEAAVEGERIGSHVIRVQRYASVSEINNCHILYIGTKDPDEIKKILNAVSGRDILTVGDTPNFARWGGMIRFYTEQNKIRLQINNTIARAEGLKISSKLLRVAQVF